MQNNGVLRCFGSTQHLKAVYGSGYQLEINIEEGKVRCWSRRCHTHGHFACRMQMAQVKAFVQSNFETPQVLEERDRNIKFRIGKSASLGKIFRCAQPRLPSGPPRGHYCCFLLLFAG